MEQQENANQDSNLENFKKLVRKAVFLKHEEEIYFEAIPNSTWKSIFDVNFNGNFNYAQRVLLNKFGEIAKIDTKRVDIEKQNIHNLKEASKILCDAISRNDRIIFATDFDNDGSLAQAVINEYLKADEKAETLSLVEYCQTVNGNSNRGVTVDFITKVVSSSNIDPLSEFVIVTADNGINSREEQMKIHAAYPNAKLVITDHHNPDPAMVVIENANAIIFNPQYHPTKFYSKFNISGAATVGVLLQNVLKLRLSEEELEKRSNEIETMNKLFKVANLLDYVHTDPADKPEKDYVTTKFLTLQPLLNINNSISKIITGEMPATTIQALLKKIPTLDVDVLKREADNIHIQNQIAKTLLALYDKYRELEKDQQADDLNAASFGSHLISEIHAETHYSNGNRINPNYIEQLRPLIFGLTANERNSAYLDELNNAMIKVFESVKASEAAITSELRAGDVVTKKRLHNSVISYADADVLAVFNRKFLNKAYNDENPGFSLTLDSVGNGKVSGSFRSLYDISEILHDKASLENKLGVKIETPGHEKAAGFIVKSLDPENSPITEKTIEEINSFIDASISEIKKRIVASEKPYLLTDMNAIRIIDRINIAIRGNVSNFEKITPILKLDSNTIWTDTYSTKQYSMADVCEKKRYGYVTVNINHHGDTVIIPVELVRRIVENGYSDYLSLGYMDNGVFMADRVLSSSDVKNVIDLRGKNSKTDQIAAVFEKDFNGKHHVELTREQIKDNPFFKYSDYGTLNFDLFEQMVIGIIDSNKIDTLAVFDVEANGFGNAKLMNYGAMNYSINPDSGIKISASHFKEHHFFTERGEEYLLTPEQKNSLVEISSSDKASLPLSVRRLLLVQRSENESEASYFLHPEAQKAEKNKKIKKLPFQTVKNHIDNQDGTVTFNREIQAVMLAFLIKDDDFKVPYEMTNLTGITQELLDKYGIYTSQMDDIVADFYKDKNVLFGAHNTPYDAKVLRANCRKTYDVLTNNLVYDSALFSREDKLAYDDIKVSFFENLEGIPKTSNSNVYFYDNPHSEFSLTKFIENDQNGYFPDRTNNYLLEIEDGKYYFIDKKEHKKVRIQFNKQKLTDEEEVVLEDDYSGFPPSSDGTPAPHVSAILRQKRTSSIPNISIKYSVEKLSEQWMIRQLLLSDEQFDIKHVDLEQTKYKFLRKHSEALDFMQDNYHFNSSPEENFANFVTYYENYDIKAEEEGREFDNRIAKSEEERVVLREFFEEFLTLNKGIQQKFSDSWMYKQVLEIKDPVRAEVTEDLKELVHYQTSIPKDKIEQIFEAAIKFKEKHNINRILHHEGHVNGPWEGDNKGDVAFEDKLTLAMLAQKKYNPYEHSVKNAVKAFNKYVVRARKSFDKAEKLSAFLANDSYSFRQGILYGRNSQTELIDLIQAKEASLKNSNSQDIDVVKFKLANDVLPQNSAVFAVAKKGVSIDREIIESDSEKLSFIVSNEQLKQAFKKNPTVSGSLAISMLRHNDEISLAYKKDLSTRYKHIEYNIMDYQLQEFLKGVDEALELGDVEKLKKKKISDIDRTGFEIIGEIVDNYVKGLCRYVDPKQKSQRKEVDQAWKVQLLISNLRDSVAESSIENAKQFQCSFGSSVGEDGEPSILEASFLAGMSINRKNPTKNLLEDHADRRLLNSYIMNMIHAAANKTAAVAPPKAKP